MPSKSFSIKYSKYLHKYPAPTEVIPFASKYKCLRTLFSFKPSTRYLTPSSNTAVLCKSNILICLFTFKSSPMYLIPSGFNGLRFNHKFKQSVSVFNPSQIHLIASELRSFPATYQVFILAVCSLSKNSPIAFPPTGPTILFPNKKCST